MDELRILLFDYSVDTISINETNLMTLSKAMRAIYQAMYLFDVTETDKAEV